MLITCSRAFILVGSAGLIAIGLFLVTSVGLPLMGLLTAGLGAVGVLAVFIERMRYRADLEEGAVRRGGSPGSVPPDEPLEPRFRPTSEVFVDPSTARRMRVYADPSTGERRYRAEG